MNDHQQGASNGAHGLNPEHLKAQAPDFESVDLAGIALAWSSGQALAAKASQAVAPNAAPAFQASGFVAVAIDLTLLPLSAVLGAPFTEQYCSVAAHPQPDASGECVTGVCLLAFELPTAMRDAAAYALLQAGLECRYRGARQSSGALQEYRSARVCVASQLGGRLSVEAVQELAQLGKETKLIARDPSRPLRSRVWLDLDVVAHTAGRDEAMTVGLLHPTDMRPKQAAPDVFCPIHADIQPSAYVFRLHDGRPLLACVHCRRAYTTRDASNDYDFGRFDNVVHELAKGQAHSGTATQFDVRDERYLSGVPILPGILCVKSPKGSGKTEVLAKLIETCKRDGQHVLVVGHRRTLLLAMARRLGLWCYMVPPDVVERAPKDKWEKNAQLHSVLPSAAQAREDFMRRFVDRRATAKDGKAGSVPTVGQSNLLVEDLTGSDQADDAVTAVLDDMFAGQDFKFGEPRHYYAVSLDSLTVLDPTRHRYDVVIIDESEQVFSHLVGTTLKDKRREVFKLLEHYLRVAKTVVLLDADLGMVTMTACFSMKLRPETPVRFVLNEPRQQEGVLKVYSSKAQLTARLRAAVSLGEKCYVAANSKNQAIELHQSLTKSFPGLRAAVIHSDNSATAETQTLLRDITAKFENDLDVLIASPALGTGIDITFKDGQGASRIVVDHVFGMFGGMINTHFDMDQQMMRVRHPGQVHLWVDQTEHHFETDLQVIKKELLRTAGETRTLIGYEDDGTPKLAADDRLVDIWATVRAANSGSKNRLSTLLQQLRVSNGWQLQPVAREDDETKAGIAALKLGKELRTVERFARIAGARLLDAGSAAKLEERHRKGLPLDVEQHWAIERYRIEKCYCEPVTNELIELDADGRTRAAVRILEIMMSPDSVNEAIDKRQVGDGQHDQGTWIGDQAARCVKARLLRDVLAAAGIYDIAKRDLDGDVAVEQDMLTPFVQAMRKNSRQFESVFDLKMRKNASYQAVRQLGAVVEKIGLRLVPDRTSDAGGAKVRWYRLDGERLDWMRRILAQREQARLRDKAKREAEATELESARERAMNSSFARTLAPKLADVESLLKQW